MPFSLWSQGILQLLMVLYWYICAYIYIFIFIFKFILSTFFLFRFMLPVARDMWNVNCTVYGSLPTPPLCLFLSPFLSLFLLSLTAVWTALTVVIPGPVARTRTHLVHTIAIAAPICLSRHPWGCPVCPPMILDSCPRMLSSPNRHPLCHQKHLTRYVQAWEQKKLTVSWTPLLGSPFTKGYDVILGYLEVRLIPEDLSDCTSSI